MADLKVECNNRGKFRWRVINLENIFSEKHYYEIGIVNQDFIDGQTSAPSGKYIITKEYTYTNSTNWSDYVPTPNGEIELTIYGVGHTPGDGGYWKAGEATITVPPDWKLSGTAGENLDLFYTWNVDSSQSGLVIEVRASQTDPGTNYSSGWVKLSSSSMNGSDTIYFDQAIYYYIWTNLLYNGKIIKTSDIHKIKIKLKKPDEWSWSTTESYAFQNKGAFSTLTRSRWEDFIAQVNIVVEYYNKNKGTSLSKISDSNLGQTTLLASVFRTVINKIDELCSLTGVGVTNISSSQVQTGQPIYGSYFITLSNKINAVISAI